MSSAIQEPRPLLTLTDVSAGYGELPVLRGLNLKVYPSEIVAMVGSNGAGKTTMLRALSGIIGSSGDITFHDHPLTGLHPDQVFNLGLVPVPEGRSEEYTYE